MEGWMESLVTTHSKAIYNFCYRLVDNKNDADDLYQDTFLKVIEKEDVLREIESQRTASSEEKKRATRNYLIGIAVNLWKYQKRKERWRNHITPMDNREEAVQNVVSHIAEPEKNFFQKERVHEVRHLVGQLPDKFRVVILMYYFEEMSTAEIAGLLKIPAGTVRSRLNKARNFLQKELEGSDYEN